MSVKPSDQLRERSRGDSVGVVKKNQYETDSDSIGIDDFHSIKGKQI